MDCQCRRFPRGEVRSSPLAHHQVPHLLKFIVARKRTTAGASADDDDDDDALHPHPNPKRPRKMKEYIPVYRSGGYALLIALHQAGDDMLTKEQLIDIAQPHCDSSFTAPSDPSKHYTAWASMKTLTEKNLAYCRGRPKRFCLTDAGDQVAAATVAGGDPAASAGDLILRDGGATAGEPSSRALGRNARATTASRTNRNRPPSGAPPRLGGVLPDSDDEEDFQHIARRVQASRARPGESSSSVADLATQRSRLKALYSGRSSEYGKDRPVPQEDRPTPQEERLIPREKQRLPLPTDIEDLTDSPPPRPRALRTLSESSTNILTTTYNINAKLLPPALRAPPLYKPPTEPTFSVCAASGPSRHPRSPPTSCPTSIQPPSTHSQSLQLASLPNFPFFVPEVLQPGTFTIHLLLDNREVRAKNDRDYIQNTLSNAGVTSITRALSVGDAMWIARECALPNREIALDHIVERKRLDDLVASIKDGRFHDQKFRLTKSGARNVTYIIEDYNIGDTSNMREAIETAVSSTQVVNGFFVKRTAKLDDTIRYLVRMTKMLEGIYARRPLPLIPSNLVDSRTYPALLRHLNTMFPTLRFHPTYADFSSLMSKSGALTLRDVYLKMLMCIRGISVEKAAEIQKLYPTPKVLVEAYEACDGDREKLEMIMRALEGQIGRKKVGGALSGKIAEVWAGIRFEGDGR